MEIALGSRELAIPQCLRELPQWVVWKSELRGGKATKIPFNAKLGTPASTTDPATWCSWEEALAVRGEYSGLGFVFVASDPFCGVDLDNCLGPTGEWQWGEDIVTWLGTYAETSPSGRGVKLILRGKKPSDARCLKRGFGPDGKGTLEIYDQARFFALTGDVVGGTAKDIADRQTELVALCDYLWPRRDPASPATSPKAPVGDEELERRAVAYLDAMPPAISGQHGHSATFAAATVLVHGFGLSTDRALDILIQHYNPRCEPPWSEKELRHKVRDAEQKPHQQPHGWLRDLPAGSQTGNVDISQLICGLEAAKGKAEGPPYRPRAIVRRLSDVQCEPLRWLWPGRIPAGKFTLLAGDPGLGKSFVTLDMAARISRGRAWPDLPLLKQDVGTVVLFNAEDDLQDTIAPRLERAEADRSKIVAVEGVERYDPQDKKHLTWYFSLQTDLPRLEEVILGNPDTQLVIIDPVSAYCTGVDTHKNADVRSLLAPLAELASRHRVAILGITHLNKTGSTKAVYRSMGSLAFAAAARAVWSVVKDANDPARRLFLPAKLNLAENPDGLAYCIREGRVAWEMDPVKMHADDAFAAEMAAAERARMGQGGQRQQATAWLREYVAHGRLPATQIIQDGKEQGFSEVTLRRAHKAMGGKSQKCDYGGGWVWYLPGLEDDQPRPLL